jgi:D-glycero-D-manno-heptose 1,7-bisphosphate phosphatase
MDSSKSFICYQFFKVRTPPSILILIDRDDTLIVDKGLKTNFRLPKFSKGVILFLRSMQLYFPKTSIVIITNQSRYQSTLIQRLFMYPFHVVLVSLLFVCKVRISRILICPHAPLSNCNCRKPRTEMLRFAIDEYRICNSNCYMIGNSDSDILAGINSGINTIGINYNGKLTSHVLKSDNFLGTYKTYGEIYNKIKVRLT